MVKLRSGRTINTNGEKVSCNVGVQPLKKVKVHSKHIERASDESLEFEIYEDDPNVTRSDLSTSPLRCWLSPGNDKENLEAADLDGPTEGVTSRGDGASLPTRAVLHELPPDDDSTECSNVNAMSSSRNPKGSRKGPRGGASQMTQQPSSWKHSMPVEPDKGNGKPTSGPRHTTIMNLR